jgi:O-antigen/teichoic acid export membrane protein
MITNVLNYFYNIVLGKILTPDKFGQAAYGEFYSLNSFSYYLVIPITGITYVSAKIVAEWLAKGEKEKIRIYHYKAIRFTGIISIFLAIIGILLTPLFTKFFQMGSDIPWILTVLYMAGSITPAVLIGIISGMQEFSLQSIVSVVGTSFRFVLGILLTILFGVAGSLGGNIFIVISYLLLGLYITHRLTKNTSIGKGVKIKFPWKLLFVSMASSLAFGSFLSTDVIMVKHYLTDSFLPGSEIDIPSIYSMLSLLGRIIYFLAITFATAIIPLSSFAKAKGASHQKILLQLLALAMVIIIPVIFIYFLFPETLIKIIYDEQYIVGASFLGLYGLSTCFYAFAGILNNYFISIQKYNLAIIPALCAIVQIILTLNFHSSITDFINIQIIVNICTLLGLLAYWVISTKLSALSSEL